MSIADRIADVEIIAEMVRQFKECLIEHQAKGQSRYGSIEEASKRLEVALAALNFDY
jgi:hypothetical protein